ncbi:MAG: TlpA family protein disulfide reductase, partial [Planctomycetes bacterium]|nr:TlpA family protein disulfide reductase [Planctomycetota bacterium]
RGQFTQAAEVYGDLVGKVSPQNVRFAWSFGDTLARQALAHGEYQAVRDIYSGIAQKFPNEADIQAHIEAQLQKLDLVGKAAPGFEVRDLDGKKLALDDYRSKVTLVDFWATWCGPCVAEMPNVRAVYDKYRSRGF